MPANDTTNTRCIFTLSPLPSDGEWMTFETNRNADCEDCLSLISCQKAKLRWKPAKISAVARQGSVAFLGLQRQTQMFVFALPFFSIIFPQEPFQFILGIRNGFKSTALLCQRQTCKNPKTPGKEHSASFSSWLWKRDATAGQGDFYHNGLIYNFSRKDSIQMVHQVNPECCLSQNTLKIIHEIGEEATKSSWYVNEVVNYFYGKDPSQAVTAVTGTLCSQNRDFLIHVCQAKAAETTYNNSRSRQHHLNPTKGY